MNYLRAVIFSVGNREFGIDINHVVAYKKMPPVLNNSKNLEYMKGSPTKCQIIAPIIDLRTNFLGNENSSDFKMTRLLIVERNDDLVGIIVDSAMDVMDISEDTIQPFKMNTDFDYYIGISKQGDREIIILDVQNMMENLYLYISRQNGFH
ncbi:chemotaxis protein CheW [Paenibacillus sp. N3/727]|uniref:chemotaxis protein CheW n=1 Tax=Paenibacillus sp. N3/727 TaxID=2925845 RepID=UPI001F536C17|nr:chemotaxis protein CheW [Paenibacillus sp. N3/727]UNK16272.1 chemotaxis protein CheW [Paenibacillus sp. N3/727]